MTHDKTQDYNVMNGVPYCFQPIFVFLFEVSHSNERYVRSDVVMRIDLGETFARDVMTSQGSSHLFQCGFSKRKGKNVVEEYDT